ncbi:MAG: DNA polymerase I [bacterium]
MPKTLFVIDGNGYAYRAFYAMPPLTTHDGVEIHAVFGFYNMILKVLRNKKPDYLALTFDHPKPTFRHKMYEQYKAQREKMPESLQIQMKLIKEIAAEGNIPIFEMEGFEADDIIAAAAALGTPDMKVVIITTDKDIMQLVNENVSILKFGKKEEIIITPEKILADFGIVPPLVADVLALMGDASDNIPGVEGIGEKTAYKLVQEFGTVENLYDNLKKIKADKLRERLIAGEKDARISKELSILKPNNELLDKIELNLKNCSTNLIDFETLNSEFMSYNFKSLVTDKNMFFKTAQSTSKVEQKKSENGDNTQSSSTISDVVKVAVGSAKEANKSDMTEISQASKLVVIFDRDDDNMNLVSIQADNKNYFIHGADFKAFKLNDKEVITNSSKELFKSCKSHPKVVKDILLMSYLLNPEKTKSHHSLVFSEYLSGFYPSYEDAVGKGAKQVSSKDAEPIKIIEYVSTNLDAAVKTAEILETKLKEQALWPVYENIELPLAEVLADMELCGLKIDKKFLDELIKKTTAEVNRLEKNIYKAADGEFNINSPKQLGEILFEKLNLPKQKKTKTGYSTDNEVLSALESKHLVVADILRYRMLNKLKTGFLEAISMKLTSDDKLYPSYNQAVTSTGRLSSSNPNIQNIPVRGEEGREIRKIFVPLNRNEKLIKADYSQVELRILAHFSKDEKLIEIFKKGGDIHTLTAAEVFGLPVEFLTKDHRRAAKTINFGIVYGISAFGLAKQLGVSNHEAGDYIDKFFMTFPGVLKYQQETKKDAVLNGYVETLTGRKRYMADIHSANRTIREFAERAAINAPIQGTAADLIKIAMISINQEFKKIGISAKMILQVHDELVFSVLAKETEKVKAIIKIEMEKALRISVPLDVTIGEGDNWYECG